MMDVESPSILFSRAGPANSVYAAKLNSVEHGYCSAYTAQAVLPNASRSRERSCMIFPTPLVGTAQDSSNPWPTRCTHGTWPAHQAANVSGLSAVAQLDSRV